MNSYFKRIEAELKDANIPFSIEADVINVPLPNDFGMLEIRKLGEDDDTIQIIGAEFHSHGSVEAAEFGTTREKGIRVMIESIFNGKLALIEELVSGCEPKRFVRCSMEDYLNYLPENTTYRVFNQI